MLWRESSGIQESSGVMYLAPHPERSPKKTVLNPYIIFPAAVACLYVLDLGSLLLRRSTSRIRSTHHWSKKLNYLTPISEGDETTTKSHQYLPDWRFIFGSLPQHLSIAAIVTYLGRDSEMHMLLRTAIAMCLYYVVSFMSNQCLLFYCRSRPNKTQKMANKSE